MNIEEIRRLFKALEESKLNNSMQILIDNEMCKQFQDIIETICSSKDKKDKEIENLKENWKELKEIIQDQINNPLNVEMKIFSKMVLNDMETIERIERR